jgi:DNA-binding winged helix-turn-helix (wHTH) protein
MQAPQGLVFGPFRLDRRDERLWRGHEAIPLSPKTFAMLCCLVTQAGQLVTKDALLEAVWPETMLSESILTVAMSTLRRVLGDQARTPRFIETDDAQRRFDRHQGMGGSASRKSPGASA